MNRTEVAELVRQIDRLPDPLSRTAVIDLVRAFAAELHYCDLPDDHDGDCWFESGTPDD
jgi:hypothetical protein